MAANTSFKVQCPSCEAMVPIRDPNLVGKKVDCPKCKYRFVVEEPDGDAGDDRPARAPAKKVKAAKKGGNNVLILGSVLGGIALIVLGVGLYLLLNNGDGGTPAKPSTGAGTVPQTASSTPPVTTASTTPPVNATPATTAAATPSTGAAPSNPATKPSAEPVTSTTATALDPGVQTPVPEITNLLPNDTQSVISINMDRLRGSTLGQLAFEQAIGFRPDTFKNGFGLGVEDISRLVRAENFQQAWSFNVIKTAKPVTLADFQTALGLKKGPNSPIQGRNYFLIAPNPLVDNLSTILQSELESRSGAGGRKKRPSTEPLTLVLLDPNTVVIAQQGIMEEFLKSNASPELKTQLVNAEAGAAGAAPAPQQQPKGGLQGRGRSVGGLQPIGGGAGGAGGEGQDGPQFGDRNAYLTVEPFLKAMLDRIERDRENMILSTAQSLQADDTIVNRVREATGFRQFDAHGMRTLGAGLHQLNVEKFTGEIAVEMIREADAKGLEDALKTALPAVGQFVGLYLGGLQIDVQGAGGGGGGGPAGGGGGGGTGLQPGRLGGGPSRAPSGGPGGNAGGPDGPKSTLRFDRKGKLLTLDIDFNLTEKAYDRIYALAGGFVMRMKGMVDMAATEPRYSELAAAGLKYRAADLNGKEKKPKDLFPWATYPREDTAGRLSRTWPPSQRVSWMAGMLPFLGYQEIYDDIQLHDSWRSKQNLKQGAVLIPAFLDPRYRRETWRAHPPSLGPAGDVGATHFVGIAGVGADAADISAREAQDPSFAKRVGVFGYERRTAVKDIADGVSNTIFMVEVPPTHQRPWIAGGGATVAGVPETRSVEPFVASHGGKRGTYVLMCDGSVRFVKEDIADDVFKALCTIKGGETIPDLNSVAPKVEPKKGPTLKTSESAKADEK
jgi:hypothetical protein